MHHHSCIRGSIVNTAPSAISDASKEEISPVNLGTGQRQEQVEETAKPVDLPTQLRTKEQSEDAIYAVVFDCGSTGSRVHVFQVCTKQMKRDDGAFALAGRREAK